MDTLIYLVRWFDIKEEKILNQYFLNYADAQEMAFLQSTRNPGHPAVELFIFHDWEIEKPDREPNETWVNGKLEG